MEIPVAMLLLRDLPRPRTALTALTASTITHPTLWAVWFGLLIHRVPYQSYVLGGEISVALVETVVLRLGTAVSWRRALGVSVLMNLASWGVGELIR